MNVELLEAAELPESAIMEHNVLLASDSVNIMGGDEVALISLGDLCRKNKTSLIIADASGLAGRVFCDFGETFTVNDKDGTEPKAVLISSVVRDADGLVITCHDETRHELETGDYVKFTEIQGLDGLLTQEFKITKVTGPFAFVVSADGVVGERSATTGWVHEVKKPIQISFDSLRESIENPGEFVLTDFGKFERPATYHACFRALFKFITDAKSMPKPHDSADADKFVELALKANPDVEKDIAKRFAYTCRSSLQPVCSSVGAMAAQEAVKAVSGKFSPVKQWWYLCLQECLPAGDITDAAIVENRYASQVLVKRSRTKC